MFYAIFLFRNFYFSQQNETSALQSVPGGGRHRLQHRQGGVEGCEGEGGRQLPSDVHGLRVVRGERRT